MNPSKFFIERPVATTLLIIAFVFAGAMAYTVLPVSPLPQIDFPTIAIVAQLPGASAETMASSVAAPLERQLGHISGVTEMTSTSSLSATSITLQFNLDRDIDGAARDVEAAINSARTYLPTNLPANPTYRKVNPADAPILVLNLTSEKYSRGQMYDVASTIIQQRLSQIQGVGQVTVGGGTLPSVRIDVNPAQLSSYGISLTNIKTLLSEQNSNMARGQISDATTTADIVTNGQLSRANDYQDLVIGYHSGSAVRLSDVAEVSDSVQNVRAAGYLNGKESITIIIFRQPGANIIETINRVKRQLPMIMASIPQGIEITTVLDHTATIQASVNEVKRTLLISTLLVIGVVFLFLRSFRATAIPSVAVPASIIGTFAAMYLLGYSLNNFSLMALTISTGFVIDDAIVVMENIARHIEAGMKPYAAALLGAREIGFTVFSISASLLAVFIPILMMGGIVGRLFREFAVTLSVAIVSSMIISLTATPMMCAHILKPRTDKAGEAEQKGGFFSWVLSGYRSSLRWVLHHPTPTLLVLLLIIVLNVVLFIKIPKGFFPIQDTGIIVGGLQGPQDASFPFMDDSIRQLVKVIKSDPSVDNVVAFTGGTTTTNGGFIYVSLKPLKERKVGVVQVIDRLRARMGALPVASAFLQAGQDLRVGGRLSSSFFQYTIQSDSTEDLTHWGPILLQEMRKLPGLQDVNSDQQNGGLEQFLYYDRVAAARLGITVQDLNSALYYAFGQSEASTIYTQSNQYYVILGVAPEYWRSPEGLRDIYLNGRGHEKVPLDAVSTSRSGTIPLTVNHTAQFPSVTISFNLGPNMSLSDATRAIGQMQQRLGTPATIHGFFSGTLEAYQQSLKTEPLLITTALLAVYIVLGILYESLTHPLTIISTLPPASVGAMLALMLFKIDLSVISLIGIILLIGIVKKNAIMMIDFALSVEREGKSTYDAIFEACLLRFRPILMTTFAALFGALPLAFEGGMGSELRHPLGITIAGGLIVSQLLTLYTTPVVYLFFDNLRNNLLRRTHSLSSGGPSAPVAQ
jgi:multidrug efflux pump